MDSETIVWTSIIGGIVALITAGIIVSGNHDARWNAACVAAGGTKVSLGGDTECVRSPVQVVTIAVKPW